MPPKQESWTVVCVAFGRSLFLTHLLRRHAARDAQAVPPQAALRALAADEKAAARRGEPPTIEGDPFIDAQEADFSDLQIVKRSADAMSAVVEADFARPNAKTREKIDYALVFERGAWRIDDMTWIRAGQPPETLRKLLAAK